MMVSFRRLPLLGLAVIGLVSISAVPASARAANKANQRQNASLKKQPAPRSSKAGTPTSSVVPYGGEKNGRILLTTKSAVLLGMMLAFNSGYVNGACLSGILSSSGTKQASAAVTGAWTNSALGFASGNKDQFALNVKSILSYITGSLIASLIRPNPVPFELDAKPVSLAFLIGSGFLYASSTLASQCCDTPNNNFIFLAAIANGIQNSITSTVTSNLVRSAHFSGITSDIGTFLGQVLRGNNQNLLKLKVFCALAVAFWIGGFVSYSVTNEYTSTSLLFSAVLYVAISLGLLTV